MNSEGQEAEGCCSVAAGVRLRVTLWMVRCCAGVSRFLPTSRRLVQFSEGKSAAEGSTIVYIDGAFDVFHAGHVEILRVGHIAVTFGGNLCHISSGLACHSAH